MSITLRRSPTFSDDYFPVRMTIQQNRPCLVSRHWHEELEFIRVLKGPVTIQIQDHMLEVNTGDIVFINSNLIHYVYCRHPKEKAIQGLFFKKEFFEVNLDTYLLSDHLDMYYFNTHHSLNPILTHYMDVLYNEFIEEEDFYRMAMKGHIYSMLAHLYRYYSSIYEGVQLRINASDIKRLEPVIAYIKAHYHETILLEELANQVHMSPYYFSRKFKETFNTSPIDYVIKHRIKLSVRLLVNSELPITLIAEKVGFSNCNYFDKAFKKVHGISPLKFRQIHCGV